MATTGLAGRMAAAAVLAAAVTASAAAQFLPADVAQRPAWEEFLRTAEVVACRDLGEGVTRPKRLTLRKDGIESAAVWKNPDDDQGGVLDCWRFEIAAYELDKLIGLNMIPPVIERSLDGRPGCLSLWAEHTLDLVQVVDQDIQVPPECLGAWNDMKYLSRAWDCLIANEDRTQQNVLYTADWRTILIDHSRAFRCRGEFRNRLMFGSAGIKTAEDGRPFLFRRLPRSFVRALETLDVAAVRTAVGPYLDEEEIRGIMERRDLLLKEIRAMIADQGEDKVLYPPASAAALPTQEPAVPEIADAEKWEAFLREAEITANEQFSSRQAVTNPWRLTLRLGAVERHGLWKNPRGRMSGYIEGWQYEIAAYLLDRHLGLNLVPPTVERRFRYERGSLQIWIDDCITLREKEEKKLRVPSLKTQAWNRGTFLQRAFDNLIANIDRHTNQILVTPDWRFVLIDHSRAFASAAFARRLIYTEAHREGPKLMRQLPRAFVEKLRALDAATVKAVVGEYLSQREIENLLVRRDLILAEIERLIGIYGEAGDEGVLY